MGETEKAVTTIMVMKVDLQCYRCYKKVKRVLCKIPQIQDQMYDEKQNTVMIKVVCCSPEKIKNKILYKGGNSIKSIEIKPPPKPKSTEDKPKPPQDNPKPADKPAAAPKPADKPAAAPKPAEKPKEGGDKPKEGGDKPKDSKPAPGPGPKPSDPAPLIAGPYYPQSGYAAGAYYRPWLYEGYGGGPFHHHGGPSSSYDQNYVIGRPVYDSYGGGHGYRPSYYSSEENPSGCIIM